MAFALVCTECVNVATATSGDAECDESSMCGARPTQGLGRGGILDPGVVRTCFPIGNVHKSVEGSLNPRKITLPLYITSHFLSSNSTLHPALQRGRMPMRDATVNDGTIWPNKVVGKPGMEMSHICDDLTFFPSGKFIVSGVVAIRLLTTSTPSMIKMDVAPVSAMV